MYKVFGKQAVLTAVVSLVLLGVLVGVHSASAGQAQKRAVTGPVARNAALTAATGSVLKETSVIRQLSILRPVKSSTQTRAEIERMIIKSLDEETTPAEIHATEITWKKLGVVPGDFQYRQFLVRLLTEQVAGYYEPQSQQFYLADWIDLDAQKPVMAHELTHALQDQHFNLRRFEHWPKSDGDAELAARALIEGDASLAMELYIADNPMRALSFLKAMGAGMASTVQLDRAPRVLRESLLFPYFEGRFWAKELYKQGGWRTVSQAFTELPRSTEQILHSEKYFAHEPVVKVALPDITNLLNRTVPQEPNWRRVDYDVNGEWGYYLILDEFLKANDESKRAAAGWGGDRYAVYEGPNPGDVFIAQLSVWDSEKDAREFFEAYAKRTGLRYAGSSRSEASANGTSNAWRTSEGSVVMNLRGSRVLILEGLPVGLDPQNVARALGQ